VTLLIHTYNITHTPLCVCLSLSDTQYERMFGLTRLPGRDTDWLLHSESLHVAVCYQGTWWRVELLRCVCNVLQHTATYCNILQYAAPCCSTPQQLTATYCNILQHTGLLTAIYNNILQHTGRLDCESMQVAGYCTGMWWRGELLKCVCNILQHTAKYCTVLQHASAAHCTTLQHTATY